MTGKAIVLGDNVSGDQIIGGNRLAGVNSEADAVPYLFEACRSDFASGLAHMSVDQYPGRHTGNVADGAGVRVRQYEGGAIACGAHYGGDFSFPLIYQRDGTAFVKNINNVSDGRKTMKIVILDGYTENPGDLSWADLEKLGELTVYDRTPVDDEEEILRRIGDVQVVYTNKTPLSGNVIRAAANLKFIGVLATGYNVVDVAAAREISPPMARRQSDNLPSPCFWKSATMWRITARPFIRDGGQAARISAFGIIHRLNLQERPLELSDLAESGRPQESLPRH